VVRVYDKIAEINEHSEKFWFFDLWRQKENVWRIEFQVRGERLRSAGIRSLDDLRSLQNDLLRELATNHTTLTVPTADGNRARWPLHPLWRALLADIDTLPQTGLIREIDPAACLAYRVDCQLRSFYGSCKGLAALLSELKRVDAPLTLAGLLAMVPLALARHHNAVAWRADVTRRIEALRLGQW
jgi:hypothetical protein